MTNCDLIGIDWREQSWWSYQTRLMGWNAAHADKPASSGGGPKDPDRLKVAMAAHMVQ